MIDFKELPEDGIKFEQLSRELLKRSGFEVHWTGVGQDNSRDLIIIEKAEGTLAPFKRKWLVSCKHFAHSNKSVGLSDIQNITDQCAAIDATGFLLVCSTQPTSSVIRRFEEIENQGKLILRYWDSIEIEKRLDTPETFPLIHIFFPKSAKNNKWKIYNTTSPSFWAANYKDYFLYLSSRTANTFPELRDIEKFIKRIESISLPEQHYLRIRAVYFDNKHCQYVVFLDYLYPSGDDKQVISVENILQQEDRNDWLWTQTYWDIKYINCYILSDHFHLDHKDYYIDYFKNFQIGLSRD